MATLMLTCWQPGRAVVTRATRWNTEHALPPPTPRSENEAALVTRAPQPLWINDVIAHHVTLRVRRGPEAHVYAHIYTHVSALLTD